MKNVTSALRNTATSEKINFGALFHVLASNALLQAMAKLWLKLDIIRKKQKQDSRLLAVSSCNSSKPPTPRHMGSVLQLCPDGLAVP